MLVPCGPLVHRDDACRCRRALTQSAVRSDRVVVDPPLFDSDLGFPKTVEDLAVQQLVPEPCVEAFAVSIFPRRSWLDIGRLGPERGNPAPSFLGRNSGPLSDLMYSGGPRKMNRSVKASSTSVEFTIHADHKRLSGVFIDDVQCPIDTTIGGTILDKIIGPDVVRPLWAICKPSLTSSISGWMRSKRCTRRGLRRHQTPSS